MPDRHDKSLRAVPWSDFLRAGDRVGIAVSGGADSVALLRLLLKLRDDLGIVLAVVHVNHKLRGHESDEDEQFVRELAAAHGLELYCQTARVPPGVSPAWPLPAGIEAEARRLRYQFFTDLMLSRRVSTVATAHTLDDQAETVLLRIFRGTGIRGLAGIHPRLPLQTTGGIAGEVVRPLLTVRREELRSFLSSLQQTWREDSSNDDESFRRNRVRRTLLPAIVQEFGDSALQQMSDLAEIARAEYEWTEPLVASHPLLRSPEPDDGLSLPAGPLLSLPLALARRIARAWIEENVQNSSVSFRLIEEVLELARSSVGKQVTVPVAHDGQSGVVRRTRDALVLESTSALPDNYEYSLPIPGEVEVPELAARVEAVLVDCEAVSDRSGLLDLKKAGSELMIRAWRPGDRFWPGHSKSEKKIKELLTEKHAAGPEKKRWPLAVRRDGTIVWLREFPIPDALRVASGTAIQIRCVPLPKRT